MPLKQPIKAILFDYGNTLIEFSNPQLEAQSQALVQALETHFGPCDQEKLTAIRRQQIRKPYENGFRENDLTAITRDLICQLYDRETPEDALQTVMEARYTAFLDAVSIDAGVKDALKLLSKHYQLVLVSNYPCSRAINDSLQQLGIMPSFSSVIVSADLGIVKPHPEIFSAALQVLPTGTLASKCLFVGDNWLADIQGSKRAGMQAVLTTQYAPYDTFDRQAGDHEPDATISHFLDLQKLLGVAH